MTLDQLQARLGHVFADARLLQEALTHRSFGQPNNERFEFLGDSILNCVIAIALFERFGELREGELSRVRASLVRQDALHRIALDLDLGDCLRLGEGELKSGGSRRPSILADAVEALFAAVFLDAGFAAAKAVVDRLYVPLLAEVDPLKPSKDPKTALQEWLQGRKMRLPQYEVARVLGAAHRQTFEVVCQVAALGLEASGQGVSRRAAEQAAAAAMLQQLQNTQT